MEHKLINQRNEKEYVEYVDVQVTLNKDDLDNLSKREGYVFNYPINKRVGTVLVTSKPD